jgi:hypothetical protein
MGLLMSRSFRRHHLHFVFPSFFVRLRLFLCPGLHSRPTPRGAAVNIGRRLPPEAARSDVDGREHGARLGQVGFARPGGSASGVDRKPQPDPDGVADRKFERTEGSPPFARALRVASLYSVGPCRGRTMKQSFASAARLRGGGPILWNGPMTMLGFGSPPPRIVSGQPGKWRPAERAEALCFCWLVCVAIRLLGAARHRAELRLW